MEMQMEKPKMENTDNIIQDREVETQVSESSEVKANKSSQISENLSDTKEGMRSSQTKSAAEQSNNENISNTTRDKESESSREESSQGSENKELSNNKTGQNPMRQIEIEKMVLHCGGTEDKHEKDMKLLKMITNRKICEVQSTRRIPAFGISPGKKSGCKVTLRNKEQINELLKRFFAALDNQVSKKQITENQVCFGIHEYIEVPGLEYDRDIGIIGFEVMLVFKRKGKRVVNKKIKRGLLPRKQQVSKEEIIDFLIKNFGLEIVEKKGGLR